MRRRRDILRRALAALMVTSVMVWALAGALQVASAAGLCPMAARQAMLVSVTPTPNCCGAPQQIQSIGVPFCHNGTLPTDDGGAMSEAPGRDHGCCCPAVGPVAMPLLVLLLPPAPEPDWLELPEPAMADRLIADELIIPPTF
ncbi:MAG TPA: hypothetical protein VEI97_03100 [bacterium]|nr:hypothetical protein [bacterium]